MLSRSRRSPPLLFRVRFYPAAVVFGGGTGVEGGCAARHDDEHRVLLESTALRVDDPMPPPRPRPLVATSTSTAMPSPSQAAGARRP